MSSNHPPSPPLTRGESRPVRRRTRTFRPNYLSFAGTYQCNLSCPHCCVPIEWTDRLDIPTALRFLEQAHGAGIEVLGFTGGEPFLYPEFLVAITGQAAELGFRFDKLMTNGVWHRDGAHLTSVLTELRDAGFTGKIGLSVDKFHGMDIAKLSSFCRIVRSVFDRDTILSLSYASRTPDQGLEPIRKLAQELDGVVEWSPLIGRYLLVSDDLTMTLNWNHLATVERAEALPGNPWDGTWFEEDYCEGPGQALIVNPKGEVKPCCGFASDLDQLTIGNIYNDSVSAIITRARKHPVVGTIFRKGLSALREQALEKNPDAFPGSTSNHCYFCWYVLTRNLLGLSDGSAELSSSGRRSLPLAADSPVPPSPVPPSPVPPSPVPPMEAGQSTLYVHFDGRKVFLGQTPPPPEEVGTGRVYAIEVSGPTPIEIPQAKLTWTEYQAWIDRLREKGYTLTTHNFSLCAERK